MNFFNPDIEPDIEEIEISDPDEIDADTNTQNLNILKGQLIGSATYIIVLILSIIILYNQILKAEGKEPFLEDETVANINILNKIVVFILVLYFFYTTYENVQNAKEQGEDTTYLNLQLLASLITVVSAIIVLYVSFAQSNKSFVPLSSSQNPNT